MDVVWLKDSFLFSVTMAMGFFPVIFGLLRMSVRKHQDDDFGLWLLGEHQDTWANKFCNGFDSFFGKNHLSFKCFGISAICSVLIVCLLYCIMLLEGVIGENTRTLRDLDIEYVLLYGVMLNVLPDYISLFQTRWLLGYLRLHPSILKQLLVLFLDAIMTGTIIFVSINVYQSYQEEEWLNILEMIGVFHVFAIFFYSTFLTSVWAWLYCISTWLVRIANRYLSHGLIGDHPFAYVSVLSSLVLFIIMFSTQLIIGIKDEDGVSLIDKKFCSMEHSLCSYLARQYEYGIGVEPDPLKADTLYMQACVAEEIIGCLILRFLNDYNNGVEQDLAKGATLFQKACDSGEMMGCYTLGVMYQHGFGVEPNPAKAATLFQQACDGGDQRACESLLSTYR